MTEAIAEMGIGNEEQNKGAATGVAVVTTTDQDQSSIGGLNLVDVGGVKIKTVYGREEVDTAMHEGLCVDRTVWKRNATQHKRSTVAVPVLSAQQQQELKESINKPRHEVSPLQRPDPLANRKGEA